jgi:hypothetical protein
MMCLRQKISREMRADPFVLESNGVNDVRVGGGCWAEPDHWAFEARNL